MYGWIDEWINGWVSKRVNGRKDGCIDTKRLEQPLIIFQKPGLL